MPDKSISNTKRKSKFLNNQISQPTNIILHIIFLLGVIVCVYPTLVIIGSSFTDEATLKHFGYNVIPRVFSTKAYSYVATTGITIIRAYGVTMFVTVAGTLLNIIFTSMFAYPLTRPEFPWRRQFSIFIYITMVFGGGLIPWYILCTQILHLQNTLWGLFVPSMFGGWNAFVLRTFIQRNIPNELIESARMDGSSEWNTYLKIVLPLSKAGLATIGFFTALVFWNDWYNCLLFNSAAPKLQNLGFLLYQILMQAQYLSTISSQQGMAAIGGSAAQIPTTSMQMAMCVLAVGPIILVYPYFQRFFVKGLVIGAVKG